MAFPRLPLLAILATSASGAAQQVSEPAACPSHNIGCLSQPPALLQTRQAVERSLAGDAADAREQEEELAPSAVPPLVPAFVAPPEATRDMASRTAKSAVQQSVLSTSTHSEGAWESYLLLKELRKQGFTCPGGQRFPPNSGELQFDCRLWKAAQLHSADMGSRNYFSHVSPAPERSDPFDRSAAQGFGTFNENIAAGVSDASGTLEQWKKSDGHCTNMMDAGHNRMGVGYAYAASSTYKHYWTQLFGSDSGAVDTSCYLSGGSSPVQMTTTTTTQARGGSWGGGRGRGGGGASGGGGGSSSCSDQDSNCQHWASLGYCAADSQYSSFMRETCASTCGCDGSSSGPQRPATTAAPARCVDADTTCSHWAGLGYCEQGSTYAGFMSEECKKSCGFCS